MDDESPGGPGLDERIRRIEEIVRLLDSDSLGLDDAMALFEEGVRHLATAREILAQTELRIEELIGPAADTGEEKQPPEDVERDDGNDV